MALTFADRGEKLLFETLFFYIFAEHFLYIDLFNHNSGVHLQEDFPNISAYAEKSTQTPTALC